jgi:hypothetical protein
MPNSNGPYNENNRGKPLGLPPHPGIIIGYTGDLQYYPTVYFTLGHYTLRHEKDWDVGWDSCENWECKFFGNVPENADSSSHHKKQCIPPDDYVKKLNALAKGLNRFKGGQADRLASWELNAPDQIPKPKLLREFWIRKGGNIDEDRFAHPSRHHFIPVLNGDQTQTDLRNQLLRVTPPVTKTLRLISVNGEWRVR